ncbi:aromatic ring-hydroxylating oxygenase subunit alpha [Asticcacaulis taihuensis]|uniref:Choline monooxygenase n=1 Tax=Asticcacaulis taihuensis TaxID=260084 RepID=A0A1G4SVY2_9CAUL|nr:SRPBCC family protein [Asticcacaulis taihuensis]SCW72725.1 choline monooxygenase [Asticcacaulis taihuensis]
MMDTADSPAKTSSPVTAPAKWYVDPAFWPIERQRVFADHWQFLTHESALAKPCDWRADILAGYPVVIVRGDDGTLRAFHNVCRHRAGPLTREESGTCDGYLTCQYHGWRYTLDGRLRAARDFGAASDFDPREYGLYPIKLQVWRGLVFAGIGENLPDFQAQMAPLDARLKDTDWSNLKVGLRRTHLLDCNWKTYVENYLEGYHVPAMHPSLDAEIISEQYKVTVEGHAVLHDAPPKSGAVYDGLWGWVWPNIGINVYNRGLMIERMSPVGHKQTQLDYLYLTPDGEPVPDATIAMSDQVTAEDKWIAEKVQQNLDAGVYDTGRLSPKHETAVAAFQNWVAPLID